MGYLLRSLRFSTNLQKTELRLSATERVVHACVCVCVCARRRASAATSRILSGRNLRKACRKSTDWHRTRVSCDSNIGRRMRHDAQAFPSVNPFVNLLFVRWNLYRPPLPPFLSLSHQFPWPVTRSSDIKLYSRIFAIAPVQFAGCNRQDRRKRILSCVQLRFVSR